jgi:hypothetical protein
MAEGAWLIIAIAVLIVFTVIALIYAIDTWPRRIATGDIYGPDPAPETTEQRFRKAHGEDGQ